MNGTAELLAHLPFLAGLDRPTLERLIERLPERRFPKGRMLFREGEPCDGFWIVVEGSVNVEKVGADGRVVILETSRPGEYFALVSAVDGGNYPASATTREDSRLLFFPRRELEELFHAHPVVAVGVARNFAARLRGLTSRVAGAAFHDVRARVATFLLQEAERGAAAPDGTITVKLEAPQGEIASRLGTVREVLARALRTFRERKLIKQQAAEVTFLDLPGLREVAGGARPSPTLTGPGGPTNGRAPA
jgi:CRP/FNR family transcriptional regulator